MGSRARLQRAQAKMVWLEMRVAEVEVEVEVLHAILLALPAVITRMVPVAVSPTVAQAAAVVAVVGVLEPEELRGNREAGLSEFWQSTRGSLQRMF